MSREEINAFVQIINRTALTQAEALWINGLIKRWNDLLQQSELIEQQKQQQQEVGHEHKA